MRNADPTHSIAQELLLSLVPGQPLLVTGRPGKFHLVQQAFRSLQLPAQHFPCAIMGELDMQRLATLRSARPTGIILSDVDRLPESHVGKLRHFLAVTSRTVVLIAENPAHVADDLLAQVQHTVQL